MLLSLGGDSVQDQMLTIDKGDQERTCRESMTANGASIYYYPTQGSYPPDKRGRATGAVACLHGPMPNSFRDKTSNYTPPGYDGLYMQRGHLIANRFGGANNLPANIVPQYSGRNMSDMKIVENDIGRRLTAGETIYYAVIPIYDPYTRGHPAVPKGIQIYWSSSSGDSGNPYIENSP